MHALALVLLTINQQTKIKMHPFQSYDWGPKI